MPLQSGALTSRHTDEVCRPDCLGRYGGDAAETDPRVCWKRHGQRPHDSRPEPPRVGFTQPKRAAAQRFARLYGALSVGYLVGLVGGILPVSTTCSG